MLTGLLDLPWWGVIVATLILTHITIAAVTIFLHRHQSHRALDLHPIASHFFRFWLWLTTGMVTKEWAAVHRKHHARVETSGDPHSPQVLGIRKVLWQGAELYRSAASNQATVERFGHGTPDDWLERRLYTPYCGYGVVFMLLIDILLFGVIGITVWAVQMIWIPFFAAGVINGIGHYFGYRNFESPDASRNIVPIGVLIGGEELHNNHHAFASSAKLSSRWWEFDIGWVYIRMMSLLGLARVKKVASSPLVVAAKAAIDPDTVKAVIGHRFHVMARYAKHVIARVYREELAKADQVWQNKLRSIKSLLSREESLLDDSAKQQLQSALANCETLKVVYQFKMRLQALWSEKTASQERLVKALQDWCLQAEATGIKALEDFAVSLRGYTLQRA
jgi:stearoyl-CoA desaturase (delta-9 desaturase)